MTTPNTIKIDDVEYIRADSMQHQDTQDGKPYVIVRSKNQGVMSGYLDGYDGQVVRLSRARQLWQWKSGFVLPEMAEGGPDPSECKFSCEMSQQMVMLEACGILFCTEKAARAIRAVPAQVR